jgi:hypothetical protein
MKGVFFRIFPKQIRLPFGKNVSVKFVFWDKRGEKNILELSDVEANFDGIHFGSFCHESQSKILTELFKD